MDPWKGIMSHPKFLPKKKDGQTKHRGNSPVFSATYVDFDLRMKGSCSKWLESMCFFVLSWFLSQAPFEDALA